MNEDRLKENYANSLLIIIIIVTLKLYLNCMIQKWTNQNSWILFFSLLLAITVYSCKKEIELNRSLIEPPNLKEVKLWYSINYPKSTFKPYAERLHSIGNDTINLTKFASPDWSNLESYNRGSDSIIEASIDPTVDLKIKNDANISTTFTKSSYIILKRSGKYEAYIMTIVGDDEYTRAHESKFANNKYNNRESDFGGYVYYITPTGQFVDGWKYKKGQIIGRLLNSDYISKKVINSITTNQLSAITYCGDWYQTVTYGGTTTQPVYLGTTCYTQYFDSGVETGGSSGSDNGSGSSGGGSSTSSPTPNPSVEPKCIPVAQDIARTKINTVKITRYQNPDDGGFPPPPQPIPCASAPTTIINDLTGCNAKVVNQLNNINFSGRIRDILQNVFNVSDQVNLHFVEGSDTDGHNAKTVVKKGVNGSIEVMVTVNPSVLPDGATQDYKASVFIHEVLHGYFQYKGIDYNNQLAQHSNMANYYVNDINSILNQAFGTSQEVGYSLALNGLGDFQEKFPNEYNSLLSGYKLTEGTKKTNVEFQRAGMFGKGCPIN